MTSIFLCLITSTWLAYSPGPSDQTVSSNAELMTALRSARPGTTILIRPGTYPGGVFMANIHGSAEQPIVIKGLDPKRPPVIAGQGFGIMFSKVSHLELRDIVIEKSGSNGLNIDDGAELVRPSHHILLKGLTIRDVGPNGNRDGIKLSGVDDFRVEDCLVERWGSGGSGIDMVGCHKGVIIGSTFKHGDAVGDNAIQTKGGSSDILIQRCRFEHAGHRAVNIGGSTGLSFFRPASPGHEASKITVEDCTFIGSMAPVAFVGIDGAVVRHNTIYLPKRWAVRVLQETRAPGFVPCRNGKFLDNLLVFRSSELAQPINVSDQTEIASFEFARNAWYCLDRPDRSKPRLPVTEKDGRYGIEPRFLDVDLGDLRLAPDSPLKNVGVRPLPTIEK